MYFTAYLKRFNHQDGVKNLNDRLLSTLKIGLLFWPGINYMAYRYVPLHNRQPFIDCFAFIWSVILSLLNNRKLNKSENLND